MGFDGVAGQESRHGTKSKRFLGRIIGFERLTNDTAKAVFGHTDKGVGGCFHGPLRQQSDRQTDSRTPGVTGGLQ
ncbi:MAG TPA: hypothetical protein VK428_04550 [Acidimicrobiales bacterium]|nr:hypothetical protein [Acidimicrobiales bacterium]